VAASLGGLTGREADVRFPGGLLHVRWADDDHLVMTGPAVCVFDAELDPVESSQWFAKVARNDYSVGLNLTGNGIDDPDQSFYEFYTCNAEANYDGYCSAEFDKMVDQQSREFDQKKRKQLVWEIEKKLAEDVARPMLYHSRSGTCWQPYVKGYTVTMNSIYNGMRMEDVWLDK